MELRKIFVLGLSLISTLSVASDELEPLSLPINSLQVVAEELKPPLSPRSASRKAFKDHQEISPDDNITINLKGMSYEEFLSLQRLLHRLNISNITPKALVESYSHVKPLYQSSRDEFNILSLGGGGTRGFIQTRILHYIEKKTGKSIHELFDLVIGTSTGCFTVAGACFDRFQPTSSTIPTGPYTAKEISNLYTKESKVIFGSYYRLSMKGMRGTQYDSAPLEKIALEYFGNRRLADAKIPVIFTVQDLNTARPFLYDSSSESLKNKSVTEIIREVTSAPNYFEPVQTTDGKTSSDCGITNNNPILFALSEGSRIFNVGLSHLNVFSLETGFVKPDPSRSYKNLGALDWFEIISTNIFNGESQHFAAERLIKAYHQQDLLQGKGEYFRLQFNLPSELYELDKYEPKFFEGLKKIADSYIEENKLQLDAYIEKLMRAKGFIVD